MMNTIVFQPINFFLAASDLDAIFGYADVELWTSVDPLKLEFLNQFALIHVKKLTQYQKVPNKMVYPCRQSVRVLPMVNPC